MANTFRRKLTSNVGNTFISVGSYTVATGNQVTIIGLTLSNKTTGQIAVDATIDTGTSNTYIIASAPIPSGASLVIIGGDQKVVLEPGDRVLVRADTANSADIVMSILEIT
jgi:hypothetical protein